VNGVRIDKWLWAARFFKTRALASKACELGRVDSNGQPVKPSREVRVGDLLRVKNESGEFQVAVLILGEMRGPAVVAQTLYRETEARIFSRKVAQDGVFFVRGDVFSEIWRNEASGGGAERVAGHRREDNSGELRWPGWGRGSGWGNRG
jgi:ribosome-associated heat shock protein Hsp15